MQPAHAGRATFKVIRGSSNVPLGADKACNEADSNQETFF
jgi:hypothetical protein